MKEFIFKLNNDDVFAKASASEVDLTSKADYNHTFFNLLRPLYRMPGFFQSEALDLWYISLMIYYVDKKVLRNGTFDNWTREVKLYIPVLEPDKWNDNKDLLIQMISYLSGDIWDFEFRKRELNEKEAKISKNIAQRYVSSKYVPDCFCMLSGGLDSFIGAIDFLSVNKNIAFIGHYGGGKGVKPFQDKVISLLIEEFDLQDGQFFNFNATPIGGVEDTTRTRSFMFFMHAIILASCTNKEIDLYIPENGLISLNIPLTNSRLGSSSTRTTHPYYLKMFQKLLVKLGIKVTLKNPYQFLTKGEMLLECKKPDFIKEHYKETMSCSHPDQVRWVKGSFKPKHCGTCLPCTIRRASVLKAFESDATEYRDVDYENRKANIELRSYKIGLLDYTTSEESLFTIQMSGKIDEDIDSYIDLYKRGMTELATFISTKND
ncbi:Qat anti-phage system QueC-like protein QatC [Chryseobacterium sp. 18068]|uniref:Qat anti-phage system QueC-like protein QatC n=1 Tax=Chryseobacterium sp. 18068 TaxID=2681414 RepID=UPI001358FAE7|nr:Qat anti-phage system QueC-like protein QatC [Chryseobacterium sp. 18068]